MSRKPIEFFDDESISKDKCKELAKDLELSLEWENESVSSYSPYIISDEEILARQIFVPTHYDKETGKMKPTAYDDVFNKGLSLNRLLLIDISDINEIAKVKAINDTDNYGKEKDYLGYVTVKVIDIRSLLEDELRIFGVYDSSLKSVVSHADICEILQSVNIADGLSKKAAKASRRKKLAGIFSKLEIVN